LELEVGCGCAAAVDKPRRDGWMSGSLGWGSGWAR
jgi:hypothetical protein